MFFWPTLLIVVVAVAMLALAATDIGPFSDPDDYTEGDGCDAEDLSESLNSVTGGDPP